MNRERFVELAKSYAAEEFLCSESVLLAGGELLEWHSELIPRIATGFGAGIGCQGLVCGAVSGAIMVLSLRFGRDKVEKQATKPYWFASEFLRLFATRHTYVTCRKLTGCDLNTKMGRKKYMDEKMWDTRCRQYVETASGIAFDLIAKHTRRNLRTS